MITKRKTPKLCNIWEEDTNRDLDTNKGINATTETQSRCAFWGVKP